MKRKFMGLTLCFSIIMTSFLSPVAAYADQVAEEKNIVVTIGADLTDDQEKQMFELFKVKKEDVKVLEVTNADERKFLEGVASDSVIGNKTFSCSYIEETAKGTGINAMILNLNWTTSYMISSALTTAGIYDCNVIAASPIEVSGTGALTGIMMAYEAVTGKELNEEKKEIATEELVVTGTVAETIGTDAATGIITDVKKTVIEDKVKKKDDIEKVIEKECKKYEITLTDEQVKMITDTMLKISKQKYDYEALKDTFNNITSSAQDNLGIVTENIEEAKGFLGAMGNFFSGIGDFFRGIGTFFANIFTGGKDKADKDNAEDANSAADLFDKIDSSVLGDDVIVNTTEGLSVTASPDASKEPSDESNPENTTESDGTSTANPDSSDAPASETTTETAKPDSSSSNTSDSSSSNSPSATTAAPATE